MALVPFLASWQEIEGAGDHGWDDDWAEPYQNLDHLTLSSASCTSITKDVPGDGQGWHLAA